MLRWVRAVAPLRTNNKRTGTGSGLRGHCSAQALVRPWAYPGLAALGRDDLIPAFSAKQKEVSFQWVGFCARHFASGSVPRVNEFPSHIHHPRTVPQNASFNTYPGLFGVADACDKATHGVLRTRGCGPRGVHYTISSNTSAMSYSWWRLAFIFLPAAVRGDLGSLGLYVPVRPASTRKRG